MKLERPERIYFDRYSQGIKTEKYSYYQTVLYFINQFFKKTN
ncbi:MAG: hypothetical protein ACO2Y1_05950 [Flavobacteriaceae bacterium]|jgi:hypothetical protein